MNPGLYKEDGKPEVYYVSGDSKRWIKTPDEGFAEFGPDYWHQITHVATGTLSEIGQGTGTAVQSSWMLPAAVVGIVAVLILRYL